MDARSIAHRNTAYADRKELNFFACARCALHHMLHFNMTQNTAAAVALAPTDTAPFSGFTLSGSQPDNGSFIIYGPPDSGKTFTAGTASEQWPLDPLSREHVQLNDILWVEIDDGCLDGFRSHNISVPTIRLKADYINKPKAGGKPGEIQDVARGLVEFWRDIKKGVAQQPAIRTVVFDTVSHLDDIFGEYLDRTFTVDNLMALYGKLGNMHRQFYFNARALGCRTIFLFHPKDVSARDNEKVTEGVARRASALPGGATVSLDVGGKVARGIYIDQASLVMYLKTVKDAKAPGGWRRQLHTEPVDGCEAKNKFKNVLGATLEPNMRSIFEKIGAR